MRAIRKFFALVIAAGLFVFLTYVFAIFLNPQGQAGLVAAIILVTLSAIGSLIVYGWIVRGMRTGNLNPGIDDGKGVGLGLLGSSADQRRRDDGNIGDDPSGII
jgi:hypothetical protein